MTGLLILSAASSVWYLIAAALLYGTAYGTIHPTMQALAVSQVAPDKKGTANAMILTSMI
jgi:predicted MFS family arabinose efflux permease